MSNPVRKPIAFALASFAALTAAALAVVSLDAQALWRPLEKNSNIEITLVGRNLTDRVQRNAVSLNKDEVIMPGREVRLMVRAML